MGSLLISSLIFSAISTAAAIRCFYLLSRFTRPKNEISDIISQSLKDRTGLLAANVTANNALLVRLQNSYATRPLPKPLTKAQIAKRDRDRKRGEMYLAKAHALGVYEEEED